MAGARDEASPAALWQTDDDTDGGEFTLAESAPSGTSEMSYDEEEEEEIDEEADEEDEEDDEDDEDEDDEAGTTIYFDAEDGTFRDQDGDEIRLELETGGTGDNDDDDDDEEEGEDTDGENEDGAVNASNTAEGTAAQPEQTARADQPQRLTQTIRITQQQILQLLSHPGFRGVISAGGFTTRAASRRIFQGHEGDDDDQEDLEGEDDEDEDLGLFGGFRRRRLRSRRGHAAEYPPIPSEEGKALMESGTFGRNDRCDHTACGLPFSDTSLGKRKRLARRMFDREMGIENRGRLRALNALTTQTMIPGSKADLIVNMNAKCYSGQFSEDGSFFFACGQDYMVRMYDTSNPYDWKHYKTVHFYGGQWTITDASLSPDNKHLAYSSIRSQICLASTERTNTSDPTTLDFSDMGQGGHGFAGGGGWGRSRGHFGIWSLRFSGDGREIVAGTSDNSVYVYDLEARRSVLRIPAHSDEVNAVCFGDRMSPHILYSGSDDTTLKVWDRRSLASMRPAGMFLGHTEGLTYIDSKGDGRYVISNAKDQTCKLWDLRKMINTDEGEKINPQAYTTNFDYRYSNYPVHEHRAHPYDCSLVTFRGHRVLTTLIRCHFSPPGSTDGRYIYSGSHDGKIYVWNLDGTNASEPINVLAATKNSRPAGDQRYVDRYDYYGTGGAWKTIVRDCSWHPSAPVIAATSWNGWDHGLGTCTVHTWTEGADADEVGRNRDDLTEIDPVECSQASSLGSMPMGARVTAQLQHDDRFYSSGTPNTRSSQRRRTGARVGLGALWGGDLDDDDEDYEET